MKYLKKYNESIDFEERLKSFSEAYLSYLLDNGFKIKIHRHIIKEVERCNFSIIKENDSNIFTRSIFKWDDIKDDVIPFIKVLNDNFVISNIAVSGRYGHAKYCTVDNILDDNIDKQLSELPKFEDVDIDNVLFNIVVYVDNIEK